MSAVYGVIRKLGATSKYKGYYYVVDAVEMAQKIYERPVKVTKDIYPVIARKYKSTPSNVEHNIRTLVNLCWMNHKDTLEEIKHLSDTQGDIILVYWNWEDNLPGKFYYETDDFLAIYEYDAIRREPTWEVFRLNEIIGFQTD